MKGGDQKLSLPAGFRFHPTDEELVVHYLCRKCSGQQISVQIIAEIDLYKFDPWDLPCLALYGEKEWYFFTPRDRKYPNGSRPNRAAGTGYWKATGADKPVGMPRTLGIKKALVFYSGKAPRGVKTNWIMHEYRLANVDRSAGRNDNNLRLDDWVLCRIYNKRREHLKIDQKKALPLLEQGNQKPEYRGLTLAVKREELVNAYASESGSKARTYSTSSEQLLSPEIESEATWSEFVNPLDFQHPYLGCFQVDDPFGCQIQLNDQFSMF